MANILTWVFEKLPEYSYKHRLREFLAFSRFVPKFIQDLSPLKGYELYGALQQGDVVIDAGAYPGDYAIYAAKKVSGEGKDGTPGFVICFEPNADNRKVLERNLKAFNIENVIIVPKGLDNRNGLIRMTSDGLHSEATEEKSAKGELIEVCKLDDELFKMKIDRVNKIKMDIEGSEVRALLGAKETLKMNDIKVSIATYHKWGDFEQLELLSPDTTLPVRTILLQCGYNSVAGYPKHKTTYGWKNRYMKIQKLKGKYYPNLKEEEKF